jgi:predicted 3-demethylubiquinone-9 3-methyltransferase (glyoxalase superfamily)
MSKIAPCLWFNGQAEDAAKLYAALIPNSRIDKVMRAPSDNPSTPEGAVLTVDFTLAGQQFIGLNGGPQFPFTEAVSFTINCEDQAEVDRYWDALIAGGGAPSRCGWLKDKFGLSWQIVPKQLVQLLSGPDRAAAGRAMQAMLKMTKINVAELQRAYDNP